MVNLSLQFSNRLYVERLKRAGRFYTKYMGMRCIQTLLDFSQMIVQGLWEKDYNVFQIDFFATQASKYMKREKYPDIKDLVS